LRFCKTMPKSKTNPAATATTTHATIGREDATIREVKGVHEGKKHSIEYGEKLKEEEVEWMKREVRGSQFMPPKTIMRRVWKWKANILMVAELVGLIFHA
jgi:hypothetical protein